MTCLHEKSDLQSSSQEELRQFVLAWGEQWDTAPPDFAEFEHKLHARVMAVERELLVAELARYDVTAKQIEVEGVTYRPTLSSTAPYLTSAGEVRIKRNLYCPAGRGHKSICPLELRAGVIGGYWTPRAARQGAFVIAQVPPGQSEALFEELGGMQPSRSSLDRLPKELSPHWEAHRSEWEAALQRQETVPPEARVLVIITFDCTLKNT
ncbi:MAG: hypothetical protein GY927_18440 [bacterium]|nr:hypothetical protein [bacterium]